MANANKNKGNAGSVAVGSEVEKLDSKAKVKAENNVAARARTADDLWGLSSQQIEESLSDYSVDDVKVVLDSVVEDRSRKKKERGELVAKIVSHQPHPIKEYEKYHKYNEDLRVSAEWGGIVALSSSGLVATWLMFSLDNMILGGISGLIGLMSFGLILVMFLPYTRDPKFVYGYRDHMSLADFRAYEAEEEQRNIDRQQRELAEKYQQLSVGSNVQAPSFASLSAAKQDFKNAQGRIASYETDIHKALKYPAFNDVSVPAVGAMIVQLRKCHRQLEAVDSGNSEVSAFTDSVDELWVRVRAAEETSKKIGWSEQSLAEQKDLKLAQSLLSHIDDATYSDEVRSNLFFQLKQVVDRLNRSRETIPAKVVGQIETGSRKEIEAAGGILQQGSGTSKDEEEVLSSLR